MPNKSKPKAKSGGDSRGTFTRVDDAADDGDVPHDPREVPGPSDNNQSWEAKDLWPGAFGSMGLGGASALALEAPVPRTAGGVPDAAAMASWLRGQYIGHPEHLAQLVSEIVVDTQPSVQGLDDNARSAQQQTRRDLSSRYGTMYKYDERIREWVFFSTKDYSVVGCARAAPTATAAAVPHTVPRLSPLCPPPPLIHTLARVRAQMSSCRSCTWCWRYKQLMCYNLLCCRLCQVGLSTFLLYLAVASLTTVSVTWAVTFFYSTLETLGPIGTAAKATLAPLFANECVRINIGKDVWCLVPAYGSAFVGVFVLWMVLSGHGWVKWTARRLVFSSAPVAQRLSCLPHCLGRAVPKMLRWKRWVCCCLPFHSIGQVKHSQVRRTAVKQSCTQALFDIGDILFFYHGDAVWQASKGRRQSHSSHSFGNAASSIREGKDGEQCLHVRDVPFVHSVYDTISYQLSVARAGEDPNADDDDDLDDDLEAGGGGAVPSAGDGTVLRASVAASVPLPRSRVQL